MIIHGIYCFIVACAFILAMLVYDHYFIQKRYSDIKDSMFPYVFFIISFLYFTYIYSQIYTHIENIFHCCSIMVFILYFTFTCILSLMVSHFIGKIVSFKI